MSYQTLLIKKENYIGTISMNRPEELNTFSSQMTADLNAALLEMDADPEVRVIVIKGEGRAFSAGIDLSEFEGKSYCELVEWVKPINNVTLTMNKIKKPVIASAHKFAVANGVSLVAGADLAVVSDDTKFGTTAVNIGLFCMGPAATLIRNIGRKKTLELLLTGDMIDAEEAVRIGLVNYAVPREELEEKTMELAKKIASKSPTAVQIGKSSFYEIADLEYAKALDFVSQHFASLCATEEAKIGYNAFKEKKQVDW